MGKNQSQGKVTIHFSLWGLILGGVIGDKLTFFVDGKPFCSYNRLPLMSKRSSGLVQMAEMPMVGARVSQDWHQQIQQIAQAAGRKEAEIVREAVAQYLGKTDTSCVKGAIANHEERYEQD